MPEHRRYDIRMNSSSRVVERTVLLVVLGLLIVGCFVVLRPFLSALMWAAIFCFATWPAYVHLERLLKGRRTLAAACMTIMVALVVLAPFAVIGISLVDDVRGFVEATRRLFAAGIPHAPLWLERVPLVGAPARSWWQELAGDPFRIKAGLNQAIEPIASGLLLAGVAIGRGLIELALSVFIGFFLYRDGLSAAGQLTRATERLGGDEGRRLLELAAATVRGVVYGILGTALVQATLAGIGLAIAGVPRAALLTLLTFFVSVVPIGPPLVWVPATAWLFYQGSIGWGVFMLIWGLMVSSVDNIIKPLIIRQGSRIPFVLILLGVLGGALAFGFIGVFIGPTLLAVGFRLLEQWNAGHQPTTNLASNPTVTSPAP
jgi:predicted PurR-regulated permease PerM